MSGSRSRSDPAKRAADPPDLTAAATRAVPTVGSAPQAAWAAFAARHPGLASVDVILPDLQGVVRGKRLPAEGFGSALAGLQFPRSLYALDTTGANVDASGLVWEAGDADYPCLIDGRTLVPMPWRRRAAQVLAGLLGDDGRPYWADPRAVLRRVLARFDALRLTPVVALELEFYLLEPDPPDQEPRPAGGGGAGPQVFRLDDLDAQAGFFARVERFCRLQGVPAKGVLAEYAPGQFEVNLGHVPDAVQAADHAFMLKRLVRAAARAAGQEATFMAKPFPEQAASGLHIHVSLVDAAGANLFEKDEGALRYAIGGLQTCMAESMLLFAPNANSFRRLTKRSYAPVAPTWGFNNRTVALRVPESAAAARRVEHRVAGADANPYLALAAVLAGIHHGLCEALDPGPPVEGNAYERAAASTLPTSWDGAIEAMADGKVVRTYLGEEFWRLYGVVRGAERDRFNAVITPLEYRWYRATV